MLEVKDTAFLGIWRSHLHQQQLTYPSLNLSSALLLSVSSWLRGSFSLFGWRSDMWRPLKKIQNSLQSEIRMPGINWLYPLRKKILECFLGMQPRRGAKSKEWSWRTKLLICLVCLSRDHPWHPLLRLFGILKSSLSLYSSERTRTEGERKSVRFSVQFDDDALREEKRINEKRQEDSVWFLDPPARRPLPFLPVSLSRKKIYSKSDRVCMSGSLVLLLVVILCCSSSSDSSQSHTVFSHAFLHWSTFWVHMKSQGITSQSLAKTHTKRDQQRQDLRKGCASHECFAWSLFSSLLFGFSVYVSWDTRDAWLTDASSKCTTQATRVSLHRLPFCVSSFLATTRQLPEWH